MEEVHNAELAEVLTSLVRLCASRKKQAFENFEIEEVSFDSKSSSDEKYDLISEGFIKITIIPKRSKFNIFLLRSSNKLIVSLNFTLAYPRKNLSYKAYNFQGQEVRVRPVLLKFIYLITNKKGEDADYCSAYKLKKDLNFDDSNFLKEFMLVLKEFIDRYDYKLDGELYEIRRDYNGGIIRIIFPERIYFQQIVVQPAETEDIKYYPFFLSSFCPQPGKEDTPLIRDLNLSSIIGESKLHSLFYGFITINQFIGTDMYIVFVTPQVVFSYFIVDCAIGGRGAIACPILWSLHNFNAEILLAAVVAVHSRRRYMSFNGNTHKLHSSKPIMCPAHKCNIPFGRREVELSDSIENLIVNDKVIYARPQGRDMIINYNQIQTDWKLFFKCLMYTIEKTKKSIVISIIPKGSNFTELESRSKDYFEKLSEGYGSSILGFVIFDMNIHK